MAQFDDAFEAPHPNAIPGDRMAFMENQLHYLYSEVTHLRGVTNQAPTPPPRPNLNLPEPPRFPGAPSELPSFQLKLCKFLTGNYYTYFDSQSQLM